MLIAECVSGTKEAFLNDAPKGELPTKGQQRPDMKVPRYSQIM